MQEIIRTQQRRMKWEDDLQRRRRTQMYLDFYRNHVTPYLEERIDRLVDREEARELKKYIEHDNVTQRIIDAISLVFKEKVRIRALRRGADGRYNEDLQAQRRLDELLDSCRFQVTLKETERLSKLLFDVAVLPQLREGRLELDIITGEKAFVEQSPCNPTQADVFYYQVGLRENTAQAERVDVYHAWSREGKFQCEVLADGSPDSSRIAPLPHLDYQGKLPVVMFRSYLPIDRFWSDARSAIVEKNISVDLRRTDLAMAEAYNIPQLFTVGSQESQELKKGRVFKIDIPRNDMGEAVGEAKYLNPGEHLSEQNELILSRIEQLGLSLGLSKAVISGQTATSGYELALSKYEIIERCRSEREYYSESVRELVERIVTTANQGLHWGIPEGLRYVVDFGEIRFAQSDLEREKCRQLQLQNGIATRSDFILEDNPELDDNMVQVRLQKIDDEVKSHPASGAVE